MPLSAGPMTRRISGLGNGGDHVDLDEDVEEL
jgi:hypothetical protein